MKKNFTLAVCIILCITGLHAQTILTEDFESGLFPATWSQETAATDGGWLVGTAAVLSSSSFSIPTHTEIIASNDDACNCDKTQDLLETPSMDFSTYYNVILSFDLLYYELVYDSYENATVKVSTDGGASWSVVKDLGGADNWRTEYVYLGAYGGESDVKVAIDYTDDGGWAFGIALDNVEIYEAAPVSDIALSAITTYQFTEVASPVSITGTVFNNGTTPITSFDITWSEGASNYTETFDGVNILPFESYAFTHETEYTPAAAITYNIAVDASVADDIDATNNSKTGLVSGCSFIPKKRIVAEEATGTWCGWCPRGAIFMDQMAEDYPDTFIGVAVHNSDPMTLDEYDAGVGSYPGFSGYPSVIGDRMSLIDPSALPSWYPTRIDDVVPVDMTITGSYDQTEITANVNAEFVTQLSGIDYRLNLIITEDDVTGTGSGYKQTNYYAGGANGDMGGYEDLPASVPAEDMVYNHVGRYLGDGWDGTSGSVSDEVVSTDNATQTYTVELDEEWDTDQLNVIGLIINNATGEIMNAISAKLSEFTFLGVKDAIAGLTDIDVYPNPAADYANIRMNLSAPTDILVKITDLNGKTVAEKNYGQLNGNIALPVNTINFESGIYMISIFAGSNNMTQKLVVTH